jgi:hypothetical protein
MAINIGTPSGGGGGGGIKSVQRGIAVDPDYSGGYFHEITISEVDISQSVVQIWSAIDGVNATVGYFYGTGFLTDSTTLRIERGQDNGYELEWKVIEFEGLSNIQMGYTQTGNVAVDITISQVDLLKTWLLYTSKTTASSNVAYVTGLNMRLTTDTNIHVSDGQNDNVFHYWYVVEQ